MEKAKQRLLYLVNLFLQIRFYILWKRGKLDNDPTLNFKNGWKQTLYENFQSDSAFSRWRTDAYFGLRYHPNSIETYGKAPAQFLDRDCVQTTPNGLELYVKKEKVKIFHSDWHGTEYGWYDIPYKVGQVDSSPFFEQKHGYFEIRSKQPAGGSQWTAFWLASRDAWPPEIDIYEIWTSQRNNRRGTNTIHWSEENNPHKQWGFGFWTPELSTDYHVWGCEWNEKWIKIYFDGALVSIYATPKSFIHPMHIIINSGIDHKLDGTLNDKDMKSDMTIKYVDYVKAYKRI